MATSTTGDNVTAEQCLDHLAFTEQVCPDCNLAVDAYGNTENSFKYCSFPDCGCDGARLCMAGEASERANGQNVEGMWSGKTEQQRKAVFDLIGSLAKESK